MAKVEVDYSYHSDLTTDTPWCGKSIKKDQLDFSFLEKKINQTACDTTTKNHTWNEILLWDYPNEMYV